MFEGAKEFNQPLNDWDVSTVIGMNLMFAVATNFNQPLDNWDVSNVRGMASMFQRADNFDQSLEDWNLKSAANINEMFQRSGMSCKNYDSTLMGWYANPNTPDNLWLGSNGLKYRESRAARDSLIQQKGWRFTGDEFAPCECVSMPVPEVEPEGPIVFCDLDSVVIFATDNYEEYRWYRSGELIAGEIDRELTVREAGFYKVQYLDEYGCESGLSEALEVAEGGPGHPPVLVDSDALQIASVVGGCKGYAFLEAEIRSCSPRFEVEKRSAWKIDIGNTGHYDIRSSTLPGADNLTIDTPLPLGTHRVRWILRDEFGNESQYEQLLTLTDKNPPVPVCLHGISASLGNTGELVLGAWMFDAGSWDDCTDDAELKFTFSPDLAHTHHQWTCSDLGGQRSALVPVEIWVTNEYGNRNFCSTYLLVQDNREVCGVVDSITRTITGEVANVHGEAVEGAIVKLTGDDNVTNNYRTTDQSGLYEFSNFGPDYTTLKAEKVGDALAGLSTLDILLIQKHVLGISPLESPYSLIAADINGDGQIDVRDINEIRQLLLGNRTEFSSGKSWKVIPEQPLVGGMGVPAFDREVRLAANDIEQRVYNWKAIKKGDVNHSYRLGGSTYRTTEPSIEVLVSERESSDKGLLQKVFTIEKNAAVEGIQMGIQFDHRYWEFAGFERGEANLSESNLGLTGLMEGRIGISWSDPAGIVTGGEKALFILKFRQKTPAQHSVGIVIDDQSLKPEVYTAGSSTALIPQLISSRIQNNPGFITSISPNPFSDETGIGFYLDQASEVVFRLYNSTGRLVLAQSGLYGAGPQHIKLYAQDLPAPGIYFFSLSTEERREVGRLVLVR